MAHTNEMNIALTPRAGFFAKIRNQVIEYIATRHIYRKTFNELSALSDRELNDLGITRGMIKSIAAESSMNSK